MFCTKMESPGYAERLFEKSRLYVGPEGNGSRLKKRRKINLRFVFPHSLSVETGRNHDGTEQKA